MDSADFDSELPDFRIMLALPTLKNAVRRLAHHDIFCPFFFGLVWQNLAQEPRCQTEVVQVTIKTVNGCHGTQKAIIYSKGAMPPVGMTISWKMDRIFNRTQHLSEK